MVKLGDQQQASWDPDYESHMQQALEALRTGECKTATEAAAKYNVNYKTLCRRKAGKSQSRDVVYEARRLLNKDQEAVALEYLDQAAAQAMPYDENEIMGLVKDLTGRDPGKNWVYRWAKRNNIDTSTGVGLDPKRGQNFTAKHVNEFFDLLEKIHKDFGDVPPEHIWNMDEKGIQLGGGRRGDGRKYYFPFARRRARRKLRSDNLELVTVLECVSAAGDSVPPSFVLRSQSKDNKHKMPDLRDVTEPYGGFAFSETGWTDNEIGERWFEKTFLPYTKSKMVDPTKPIILLMDGHESHESIGLKRLVYGHKECTVIILCFPSKCTHKMQPLDVVVLGPVQRKWKTRCDNCAARRYKINRYNVIPEYLSVRKQSVTSSLIQSAFRATGIHPLNRDVFNPEDFAPSELFTGQAIMPSSYPDDIPSSDPAIPTDAESDDEEDEDYEPGREAGVASESSSDTERDESLNADVQVGIAAEPTVIIIDDDPPTANRILTRSTSEFLSLEEALKNNVVVSPRDDQAKSREQLIEEVRALRSYIHRATLTIQHLYGRLSASDSHCTLAKRKYDEAMEQIDNLTKKRRTVTAKECPRYVTHPEMEAYFNQEEDERRIQEEKDEMEQRRKEAEAAEKEAEIVRLAESAVFERPFATYNPERHKLQEFQVLALALNLPHAGNRTALHKRIQDHLEQHRGTLENLNRFKGLYSTEIRRRGRKAAANSRDLEQDKENIPPSDNHVASASQSYSSHSSYFNPDNYSQLSEQAGPSTAAASHPLYPLRSHPISHFSDLTNTSEYPYPYFSQQYYQPHGLYQ